MRRLIPPVRTRPASRGRHRTATRRTPPRPNRRRLVLGGIGASCLLAMFATAWLWQSGWFGRQLERVVAAAHQLTADAGFAVDDVLVEGRGRTSKSEILAALQVRRGTPILAVDPQVARSRLRALPWIGQAMVERRLPRLLYIRLTEREPFVLWQLDGKLTVVDRSGDVIPGVPAKQFAHLPLVVGQGAAEHAASLLDMLDREPELRTLVNAAVRVSGRRWNLHLKGGIEVRLPEADAAEAWSQFARIEREHSLLGRDVVAIDLRLPGRLVVRTAPDAQIENKLSKAGHNT